jgi:peptidoglycan hydrolase-like protein with peptidoglycan-binding domain
VRKGGRKKSADESDDNRRWFVLQAFGWSHKDAIAFGVAAIAAIAILVNGLWFQTGQHPAPMFKGSLVAAAPVAKDPPAAPARTAAAPAPAAQPAPQPAPQAAAKADPKTDPKTESKTEGKSDRNADAKAAPPAPTRPAAEVVTDIQRELVRRGFYDGTVDGRYGPRTDAAIRDFEQAAGLKGSEPNEALLAAIKRSNARKGGPPAGATGTTTSVPRPPQPIRNDPINDALAQSKRVLAVQRALAEYGYGQIKPTGVLDAETKAAVEKFERERKLPVTGQVSDRVTRELAAITGRPLE